MQLYDFFSFRGICLDEAIRFRTGDFDPMKNCTFKLKAADGKMFVSLKLFSITGEFIGEIVENQIVYNQNDTFSYNYDDTGFEIIDKNNNVLISIEHIDEQTISFQGIITYSNGKVIVFDDLRGPKPQSTSYDPIIDQEKLKKHFVYTGNDYLGKRSDHGKSISDFVLSKLH